MTYSGTQLQRLALELHKRYPRIGAGVHEGTKAGIGLSPLPAREYQPGDQARHIAWPETARYGKMMVRPYRVEFDARAEIVLDLSERAVWGGAEARELKSDLARYATEALTQLLLWKGDAVSHILAAREITSLQQTRDSTAIKVLQRMLDKTHAGYDEQFVEALRRCLGLRRPKELVIVISDFLGEGWERALLALAQQHDVVAIQTQDPWDLELENIGTQVVLNGTRSFRVKTGSAKVRERYKNVASERQQSINSLMRRGGIRHIVLDTSKPLIEQLIRGISRPHP